MKKVFCEKDIPDIARSIIESLESRDAAATIIGLYGDLGAGKTTLTQEIARQLGIIETVVSPTYVIIKSYKLQTTNYKLLTHIDAYRLKSPDELSKLGWEELISNPENLILIEWPDRVEEIMPEDHIKIRLEHEEADTRSIRIE